MSIGSPLIITLLCTSLVMPVSRVRAQSMVADDDALCGPQSLLVICQSLGVDAELDELRNLSGFDEKMGTTMLGLKKAAEAKGLCTVGMTVGIGDLAREHLSQKSHNHFSPRVMGKNTEHAIIE